MPNLIDNLIALPNKIIAKFTPSNSLEARVDRYTDVRGVATKKLNLGLWYAEHTATLFLIVVWSLAVVAAVLWAFALYFLGNYLFFGLKQDQANLAGLTQSIDIVRYNYDVNLEIQDAHALPLGNDHYDLIGSIKNKNTNVWGSFNYYFLVDGKRLGDGTGFVLPNEQKFLISLNQSLTYNPGKVVLVLDYFGWRRLNAHEIPDWETYRSQHLDFVVRDQNFLSGNDSGLTKNLNINQLSFNVTNKTFFNYLQAPFIILLYSGQNIVSVNRYALSDFKPGQTAPVQLTIVGQLPNITDIAVVPDLNIMDSDNFGPIN